MKRLSIRIFLAFWAVIVLTLVAVVLINVQIHRYQRGEDFDREASRFIETRMADPARAALQRYGARGLERWLTTARARSRVLELHVLTPEGDELLGNRPPRRSARLIEAWREGRTLPPESPGQQWTRVLAGPDGREYLLIMTRPPRPFLFRLFGPFGPLGLLIVAAVVSGLVSYALARYVTRPLLRMGEAGQALGGGDLDARLPERLTRRNDEIGGLARDFNRMAEQLAVMIRSQRQLLRDVSHELRSPLARIQVALSLAERDGAPRHLARIRTESERLDALVGEILEYARLKQAGGLQRTTFDLGGLLDEVTADASMEGQPRGIGIERRGAEEVCIEGDEAMLRRAVENVVRNAVRHGPDRSVVTVDLGEHGERVTLSVADQGPGVATSELERIFEPFVRLSPGRSEAGTGGGIGLAIARAAVERHEGRLFARNRAAGGLEVCIDLPRGGPSGRSLV